MVYIAFVMIVLWFKTFDRSALCLCCANVNGHAFGSITANQDISVAYPVVA